MDILHLFYSSLINYSCTFQHTPVKQLCNKLANLCETYDVHFWFDTVSEWFSSVVIPAAVAGVKPSLVILFCPCAEHCRGVSLLHLHGETEGCSSLPTLLQTLLLQLHTSKSVSTQQGPENVLLKTPLWLSSKCWYYTQKLVNYAYILVGCISQNPLWQNWTDEFNFAGLTGNDTSIMFRDSQETRTVKIKTAEAKISWLFNT